MSNVLRVIAAAILVVVMATPTAAGPTDREQGPVAATLAGAQFHGYAPPALVTQRGGELTYLNLDIVQHDIVQDPRVDGVTGPKKKPWCAAFRKGSCRKSVV